MMNFKEMEYLISAFMAKFIYHLIGSLLPEEGQVPRFAQLYIYDTENEVRNRLNLMQDLDATILQNLQNILNSNPYICIFVKHEIFFSHLIFLMYLW